MNRIPRGALFLLAVLVGCKGAAPHQNGPLSTAYGINLLKPIDRVEILYFPEYILTRAALSPDMLETVYIYRLEIRDFPSSLQQPQFVAALRQASFSKSDQSGDLRIAVLLYDKNGTRLLSLYFDRHGTRGVVNRDPVLTNDAVYRWAKSMMKGFAN